VFSFRQLLNPGTRHPAFLKKAFHINVGDESSSADAAPDLAIGVLDHDPEVFVPPDAQISMTHTSVRSLDHEVPVPFREHHGVIPRGSEDDRADVTKIVLDVVDAASPVKAFDQPEVLENLHASSDAGPGLVIRELVDHPSFFIDRVRIGFGLHPWSAGDQQTAGMPNTTRRLTLVHDSPGLPELRGEVRFPFEQGSEWELLITCILFDPVSKLVVHIDTYPHENQDERERVDHEVDASRVVPSYA